jgi:hypothetical protein
MDCRNAEVIREPFSASSVPKRGSRRSQRKQLSVTPHFLEPDFLGVWPSTSAEWALYGNVTWSGVHGAVRENAFCRDPLRHLDLQQAKAEYAKLPKN